MSTSSKNLRWPWIALSAVLLVALAIVLYKPPFAASSTAAIVNGKKINEADLLNQFIQQEQYPGAMLDVLITIELIEQEAKNHNIEITEEDYAEQINLVKQMHGIDDDDQFQMMLATQGVSLDEFKRDIRPNLIIDKIFAADIQIEEAELQQFYTENEDFYTNPEQIFAAHILSDTKEAAQSILTKLQDGVDFATLAIERSTDLGTGFNGGEIGLIYRGLMEPEFDEVAFNLAEGETSSIVESESGFHIIKVTEKQAGGTSSFEEVRAMIHYQLFQERLEGLLPEWIDELKENAKIINKFDNFE